MINGGRVKLRESILLVERNDDEESKPGVTMQAEPPTAAEFADCEVTAAVKQAHLPAVPCRQQAGVLQRTAPLGAGVSQVESRGPLPVEADPQRSPFLEQVRQD